MVGHRIVQGHAKDHKGIGGGDDGGNGGGGGGGGGGVACLDFHHILRLWNWTTSLQSTTWSNIRALQLTFAPFSCRFIMTVMI